MNSLNRFNAEDAEGRQKTQKEDLGENDFTKEIIGAAVEVQRILGVGLLESAYVAALGLELRERGIPYAVEVPITGQYKGKTLGVAYRADIIVGGSVIVEVKATDGDLAVYRAQLLSYLRLSGLKLGLLMNFHTFPIVKSISRVVDKL
jgi:GxxExxY protein